MNGEDAATIAIVFTLFMAALVFLLSVTGKI